jgi:hypothetical protein
MAILRNVFGSLAARIIRLAVTAGILFCAYLFIVKPVLDTTEEAYHSSGLDRIGKSLQDLGPRIERQVKHSFKLAKAQGGNPRRLLHCVKRAHQDVEEIERCTRHF